MAVTNSQVNTLLKAYEEKEWHENKTVKNVISPQHENRIFTSVSGIDSIPNFNCFPALEVGALSGLASTGVQKLIGNGLYLQNVGSLCQIETDGKGLYLGPTGGTEFETVGNGLFLMKQGGLYDGRGLILSNNSPFKNIPFIDMIL